jgi:hypothetical protein
MSQAESSRIITRHFGCFVACVLLGVVASAGLFGTWTEYWDGGFPDAVYELSFRDAEGGPIRGIEVRVEDKTGRPCFHRPVNNYYADSVPTTSDDGTMTLYSHDVCFGGTCQSYFFVIRRGTCRGPEYTCRFLRNGREEVSISFDTLIGDAYSQNVRVRRTVKTLKTEMLLDRLKVSGELELQPAESEVNEEVYDLFRVRRTFVVDG